MIITNSILGTVQKEPKMSFSGIAKGIGPFTKEDELKVCEIAN